MLLLLNLELCLTVCYSVKSLWLIMLAKMLTYRWGFVGRHTAVCMMHPMCMMHPTKRHQHSSLEIPQSSRLMREGSQRDRVVDSLALGMP